MDVEEVEDLEEPLVRHNVDADLEQPTTRREELRLPARQALVRPCVRPCVEHSVEHATKKWLMSGGLQNLVYRAIAVEVELAEELVPVVASIRDVNRSPLHQDLRQHYFIRT